MDGEGKHAPHLIEEVYNLEDALVVAGFLHSFIRHADVVKIANIAQIVNVIAPVLTRGDQMLVQSIFYPFEMFSKRQGRRLAAHRSGRPRLRGRGERTRPLRGRQRDTRQRRAAPPVRHQPQHGRARWRWA